MSYEEVGKELEKWSNQVRGIRGRDIAEVTIAAVKSLSKDSFKLPPGFTEFIDEFYKREGALQSLLDYREHFIHPFHVFCLGFVILRKWKEEKWPGLFDIMNMEKEDETCILRKWFVASIYHDVGYPSEKFEALVKEIFKESIDREIRGQFDWCSILLANENLENIDKLSKLFIEKSKYKKEAEIFKKWFVKQLVEIHDHGALTALMLLNNAKIRWESKDLPMVMEAALAIALHNWKRDPKNPPEFDLGQLPVENYPLAFFLDYCDTAQEWGRKALLELVKEEDIQVTVPKLPEPDRRLDEISISSQSTIVTIKYEFRYEDPFRKTKTLQEVFDCIKLEFLKKWCLSKNETTRLTIEGRDKDGSNLGSLEAEFYGESAYKGKKKTKIEEKLLKIFDLYIQKNVLDEIKRDGKFDEQVEKILNAEKKEDYEEVTEMILVIFRSLIEKPINSKEMKILLDELR